MNDNNKKFKVGLFVLAAVGIFAFGIFKLGDITLARTYKVYIYFDDIAGLAEKSPVKIAGVAVGSIQDITLEAGKARVTVALRHDVPVYKDAKSRVASTGVIGTKYMDMSQGTLSSGILHDGDVLVGSSSVDFEEALAQGLKSVTTFVDSIRGKDNALGNNLNNIVANLSVTTLSLREIMEDRKQDISLALLSLRQITQNLKDILEKADRILAKVDKGEGAVGALFADKKVGEDVKASVANMREASGGAAEMFGRFTRIHTYWDWHYRYDTKASQGRADFGLKLAMRPTRYYFLGVSNLGDKTVASKVEDFEKKNTLSIGMGKEFFPWLDAYAGVIRGEGGVGTRLTPFYQTKFLDRIRLEGESYSFGRDTTINGRRLKGAVYNAGVSVSVLPWLELNAREEDLSQVKHFHGGVHVTIEDKDLAYLLGLVTVTK